MIRLCIAFATAMLFAGCAVLETVPSAASFDILGRVLASGEGRAFSSNVRWRHAAGVDEIWLMSPVGQTLAHIMVDASGATLTSADQQVYRAMSAEGLTERAFGWSLPLSRLQHWIHGNAVPGGATSEIGRDVLGRVEWLNQDGWAIRYDYPEVPDNGRLPRRLDMVRSNQRIRLVIDDWRSGGAQ